nr:MAG TPA: hypothetical protein [Caudoviricetes sp.]
MHRRSLIDLLEMTLLKNSGLHLSSILLAGKQHRD